MRIRWVKHDKVIYCDRPEIAKFDERGYLHCEDGPAIRFRDGWGYYYLSGVPVPASYGKTPADEIKLDEVLQLRNSDTRMAIIKKIGFNRLLATTRHRSVSEADGNSLIEFKLGDKAPYLYLRAISVRRSLPRRYQRLRAGKTLDAGLAERSDQVGAWRSRSS